MKTNKIHKWYIFSQAVAPTCVVDHHTVHTQVHRTFWTSTHNFLTLILIVHIPRDVWIVENIFINNCTLDECTHRCITYSVTAHPDHGQAWPKHVGATNWENIYHLCILFVFISNSYPYLWHAIEQGNSVQDCHIFCWISVDSLLYSRQYDVGSG
jgi:hypothetical protein